MGQCQRRVGVPVPSPFACVFFLQTQYFGAPLPEDDSSLLPCLFHWQNFLPSVPLIVDFLQSCSFPDKGCCQAPVLMSKTRGKFPQRRTNYHHGLRRIKHALTPHTGGCVPSLSVRTIVQREQLGCCPQSLHSGAFH